ncbi:hypothetical protein GGS23DRAFT_595431 [Durotheca rogersii]|uniref:uncharacterized protein n=1 Tax=Durotheca rogersii TaxID=419775 RepID=UPI002220F15E|nr:uncharacterized protein GGS23DRAFT_595431 [Durotheca rogersii]KAI5864724.1 hypothetical protein GGS23DRAFT_595431 [Durotheca rogersii]
MLCQRIALLNEARARSGLHPPGFAPHVSSDIYKTGAPSSKPNAKSWGHRFSIESAGPKAATLRAASRISDPSKIISLGIARPSPEHYPWESLVIEKFLAQSGVSTQAPSGSSQVMLYKLLDERWGHQGFIDWLCDLSSRYRRRRDTLIEACDRSLPSDVCSRSVPVVGMFLWARLDSTQHPKHRIYTQPRATGVLVSKGSWFAAGQGHPFDILFRLTFAAAPEYHLERAVERFATVLRAEFLNAV